jgi:hypothetical protein
MQDGFSRSLEKTFLCTIFVVILFGQTDRLRGFSLLGPYESWMTADIGFVQPNELGGPMKLGNEYRWNLPTIYYGFDQSFLDHFGHRGVQQVEHSVAIINNLPPVDQLSANLAEYPINPRSPKNFTAESQSVLDLKSVALTALLEQLGLTSPRRYGHVIRDISSVTNFTVVRRNYDPVVLSESDTVNGTVYSYTLTKFGDGPFSLSD